MATKVLVLGGGGREHALAWRIKQSSPEVTVIQTPVSGSARSAGILQLPVPATDIESICEMVVYNKIDLTIVGPEQPLALGIVDRLRSQGQKVFGPTQTAAQLESSKRFTRDLMAKIGVPQPKFNTLRDYSRALEMVHGLFRANGNGLVIKADGLAGGKGVAVCSTLAEAEAALRDCMVIRKFGPAGDTVLVEERLVGHELSLHAFCDGTTTELAPPTRDYKRLREDGGPNTGGMGAFGPAPDWEFFRQDGNRLYSAFVRPVLTAMRERGTPFAGCLYPGLMLTDDGPKLLEINARLGDPEAQVLMRLFDGDLLQILEACAEGRLEYVTMHWKPGYAVCVVLTAAGYGVDTKPRTGDLITGVESAEQVPGVVVFHSGTELRNGRLSTAGGRVLSVTAYAESLAEARSRAYEAASLIHFDGMHYRRDIAADAPAAT